MAQELTITVPDYVAEEARAYDVPISSVCNAALRAAIDQAEGDTHKIVVQTGKGTEAFYGQWVVHPDDDDSRTKLAADPESGEVFWDESVHWGVAVTRTGRVAVYQKEAGLLRLSHTLPDAIMPPDIYEKAVDLTAVPPAAPAIVWHHDW